MIKPEPDCCPIQPYRRMRKAGMQWGRPTGCAVPLLQRRMLARACEGWLGLRTSGHQGVWEDDTTSAIWWRGRLKEVHVTPRGVGALRVNIKIGDPLRNVFERQRRGTARGGGRGTAPGPVCPGAHKAPISDQRRSLSGVLDNACLTEARLRRRRWK